MAHGLNRLSSLSVPRPVPPVALVQIHQHANPQHQNPSDDPAGFNLGQVRLGRHAQDDGQAHDHASDGLRPMCVLRNGALAHGADLSGLVGQNIALARERLGPHQPPFQRTMAMRAVVLHMTKTGGLRRSSLMRVAGPEVIAALNLGDAQFKACIPTTFAQPLGLCVCGLSLPLGDGFKVFPIRYGHAKT